MAPDTHDIAGRVERAQGCLLGQIAGDSLGSFVEFQPGSTIRRKFPDGLRELKSGGRWDTVAGQPTDDSELALMLARTLARERTFNEEAIAAAYAFWYESGPFDMGATTARALSGAARGAATGQAAAIAKRIASQESQANGALMRISPLGVFGHALSNKTVADWARADAALTHPHQVCQDASAVFAVTIAKCIANRPTAEEAFDFARDWAQNCPIHSDLLELLELAAHEPPKEFSENMGWVRIAFHNAFYHLLHTKSVENAVVETVMNGGDTDTNAAITGALLGALYGKAAIPAQWTQCILNCRPSKENSDVSNPRPEVFWPVDVLELAERLIVAGAEHEQRSKNLWPSVAARNVVFLLVVLTHGMRRLLPPY